MSRMARNWADLSPELLELCSQRLCPKDLWAFRAVCRSWRSAALEERSNVPWLMLADQAETPRREVFCLSCRCVHKVPMPEAKAKRYFSSRGWLFALSREQELYMLKNPMLPRSYIIELPNLNKFPKAWSYSAKFVLSASPTTSLDYMVMVIYGRGRQLGLWKPGDEEWTAVNSPGPEYEIWDVIFYKGCFVAIDRRGSILRCDVNGPTSFEAQVIYKMPQRLLRWKHPDLVQPTTGYPLLLSGVYLVQSTTEFLLFVSRWEEHKPNRTFRFQVFKIDLNAQTYTEVKSLENSSLFLARDSSFSLEADEKHHIKPNCIYFADDSWHCRRRQRGGTNMGIYHIEDCTTELHFVAISHDYYCFPLWIEPSF